MERRLNLDKSWFLHVCSRSLWKTLWEKEKLLATSNFFSHSVFYAFGKLSAIITIFKVVVCKLFQCGRVSNLSFGKGLTKLSNVTGDVGLGMGLVSDTLLTITLLTSGYLTCSVYCIAIHDPY